MFPIAIDLTLCPILQPLYYATHTLSLTTIYWQTELNLENLVELLQINTSPQPQWKIVRLSPTTTQGLLHEGIHHQFNLPMPRQRVQISMLLYYNRHQKESEKTRKVTKLVSKWKENQGCESIFNLPPKQQAISLPSPLWEGLEVGLSGERPVAKPFTLSPYNAVLPRLSI